MKKALVFLLFIILFVFVSRVFAGESTCSKVFGGGQVCPSGVKFSVDKKVLAPGKGGTFVDSLGEDAAFSSSDKITFEISVTNTGQARLTNLEVKDTVPAFLRVTSGTGKITPHTLTYTIKSLDKGKSNTATFVARVEARDLPAQITTCDSNRVEVTDKKGSAATDSASFCVESRTHATVTRIVQVQPAATSMVAAPIVVSQTPPTGPEEAALLGLLPLGAAGFYLRKLTSK